MKTLIFILLIFGASCLNAQEIYFPPLLGNSWDTLTPSQLDWDESKLPALYEFLDENNTKAFILLKDGKIVLEKYFASFEQYNSWYWASAGKTLTAALVGIAQYEGLLSIEDKSSKYLGTGWTSSPSDKEDLITIRHQLTMTSGLDDTVEDLFCTDKECLHYMADAGTRWSYHNAPYTLLDKVVESASGKSYNAYFTEKIKNKIGMSGLWIKTGYNNIYWSNPRSMARYGILIQNRGNWDGAEIISDKNYLDDMVNTSQQLNKSYGYLWWLNGKESFMLPQLQIVFPGKLFPDAPDDVIAAMGANGQLLNVCNSQGIVFVRMGDKPNNENDIGPIFNNEIWKYLNKIIQNPNSVFNSSQDNELIIHPNPAAEYIEINLEAIKSTFKHGLDENQEIKIYNTMGECVTTTSFPLTGSGNDNLRIDISQLPVSLYFIQIGNYTKKFVVVR
ncbi:MAG: serine hydrolase [Desulfobulbaceae bacterium]|nr:serine hydrolase [Desulfobulbaceae bacterium]